MRLERVIYCGQEGCRRTDVHYYVDHPTDVNLTYPNGDTQPAVAIPAIIMSYQPQKGARVWCPEHAMENEGVAILS